MSLFFLSFFFYSKRYVVFITQAYAQKSTRGTLGLLVPFEVGVRGGGYRTPRSLVRGTAGEHAFTPHPRGKPLVVGSFG